MDDDSVHPYNQSPSNSRISTKDESSDFDKKLYQHSIMYRMYFNVCQNPALILDISQDLMIFTPLLIIAYLQPFADQQITVEYALLAGLLASQALQSLIMLNFIKKEKERNWRNLVDMLVLCLVPLGGTAFIVSSYFSQNILLTLTNAARIDIWLIASFALPIAFLMLTQINHLLNLCKTTQANKAKDIKSIKLLFQNILMSSMASFGIGSLLGADGLNNCIPTQMGGHTTMLIIAALGILLSTMTGIKMIITPNPYGLYSSSLSNSKAEKESKGGEDFEQRSSSKSESKEGEESFHTPSPHHS